MTTMVMVLIIHVYFCGFCLPHSKGLVLRVPPISVPLCGSSPRLWHMGIEDVENCACTWQEDLEDAVGAGKVSV